MKKTLSLLLAASFIMAPVSNCVAGYEIYTDTDSQPMGRIAKFALYLGAAAASSGAFKLYHWYTRKPSLDSVNALYPAKKLTPSDNDPEIVDTLAKGKWRLASFHNLSTLSLNKDAVVEALRAKYTDLPTVQANLKKDLVAINPLAKEAASHMKFNGIAVLDFNQLAALTTAEAVNAYYESLEKAVQSVSTPEAAKVEFSLTKNYGLDALLYVFNETKKIASWSIAKPAVDKTAAENYVKLVKEIDYAKMLLRIVNDAITPQGQPQAVAQAAAQAQQIQQRGGCVPAGAPTAAEWEEIKEAQKAKNGPSFTSFPRGVQDKTHAVLARAREKRWIA